MQPLSVLWHLYIKQRRKVQNILHYVVQYFLFLAFLLQKVMLMKTQLSIISFLLCVMSLCGCAGLHSDTPEYSEREVQFTIASERVFSDVLGTYTLAIKSSDEGMHWWTPFTADIIGFEYEPGYEYILEVTVRSFLAHGTSVAAEPSEEPHEPEYYLNNVTSKIAKISDDLPLSFE